MSIPAQLLRKLAAYEVTIEEPVSGGDICEAAAVRINGERCFLKWRLNAPPGFFAWESRGLALLRNAHEKHRTGVYVPVVREADDDFLLLEWIEPGHKSGSAAKALGHGLAWQHRCTGESYGQEQGGFIGRLPQPKGQSDNWAKLYAEKRLGMFLHLGKQDWPSKRLHRLETLCAQINRWLNHNPLPSLLHGDLWSGNWMSTEDETGSTPVLIDPASSYGDREQDMAMTELFGGFPSAFYDAYNEVNPLDHAGYKERKPFYQLYYLLVHLMLFGESYGASVDRILQRYTK
ncbi:fructosamine kinase family protein [Aneurinibacillus sp. REN35]|uniref:fructosamine kinase family protein n=1 Tax=Aneurinibacillus sp. REN35 TaxID=3237286 RepID=UPI003529BE31